MYTQHNNQKRQKKKKESMYTLGSQSINDGTTIFRALTSLSTAT
jgi:hypothetical protein